MEEILEQKEVKEVQKEVTETEPVVQEEKVKPDKKELLREMSKEYGVNLFDAEGLAKFKEYQDSQKTEKEKVAEELKALKEKENEYSKEKQGYEAQIAGLKLGIPSDKLNDALALAKINMTEGQTIEEGLKVVQEKYKAMFVKTPGVTLEVGTQMRDNENNSNTPTDPALARYEARKKKK